MAGKKYPAGLLMGVLSLRIGGKMKLNRIFLIMGLCMVMLGCSKYKNRLPSPEQKGDETIAILNIHLVPMTEEKIVKNQTVLVKGKKIIAIGPSATITVPENSMRIDGTGAYLMPGLADMHMHTRNDWEEWLGPWPVSPLYLYLANGVTTIRCYGPGGGSQNYVLRWRDKITAGRRIGPTIYSSGAIIYGPVDNPQEIVQQQKTSGFDFIKLYSFLSQNEFRAAMAAAKQEEMYVAGHIPFQVGLDGVLSEGMDEIAHIEELAWELVDFDKSKNLKGRAWMPYIIGAAFQQFKPVLKFGMKDLEQKHAPFVSSLARKVKSADVPVCTTLFLDDVIVEKLFEPERFMSKRENRYLPRKYFAAFRQGREKHQVQFRGGEVFAPFKQRMDRLLLHHLKQAGVPLVLGTDAGGGWMGLVPGFSIHDELRVLVESGFTPYEAIQAGTVNAAAVVKKMTGNDDFGTIETGKRADLILVNQNPLEDIAHIKEIIGVMAAGRWYPKTELQKMIEISK